MIIKYHDKFIEDVTIMIRNITNLKRNGKYKEAAIAGLELAKSKVNYYEQFLNLDEPSTSTNKIYQEEYSAVLKQLAIARDKCLDLGIWEN